jgi:hypothetical protein
MKPGLSSPMVLSMCLPERSVTSLPAAVAWFISCMALPSSQIAERPTLTKDGMRFRRLVRTSRIASLAAIVLALAAMIFPFAGRSADAI